MVVRGKDAPKYLPTHICEELSLFWYPHRLVRLVKVLPWVAEYAGSQCIVQTQLTS